MLDVPFEPQGEALCGGAAAAMVQRYWGDESARASDFASLVDSAAGGIHESALTAALGRGGWRALPFRGDSMELARQIERGRPVILLLRVAPNSYHYVVLVGLVRGDAIFHDPARAPFQRLGMEALERRWKPAGRWALLLLPGDGTGAVSGPGDRVSIPPSASAVGAGRDSAPHPPTSAPCADLLRAGVAAGRDARVQEADSLLESARLRCPGAPGPARELAGLRFREGRYREAAALAEQAVRWDSAPTPYSWRLLASSRYLAGRPESALAAWNRLGSPRRAELRAYGLHRIPYTALDAAAGIPRGKTITPDRLRRARRRVAALPTVARARIGYRPTGGESADLEVAVLERPVLPGGALGLALAAATALPERELRLRASAPLELGERWSATWRWWADRPRVALRLELPAPAGPPAVWRIDGSWERQGFRDAGTGNGFSALAGGGSGRRVVERSRASIGGAAWVAPTVRLRAGAELDRWPGRGLYPGLHGGAEWRGPADRMDLLAGATAWASPDGRPFTAWRLVGALRSSAERRGLVTEIRGEFHGVGGPAPLDLWPGAGTGHEGVALLRAHPLLEEGDVRADRIGRWLAAGSLETEWWAARAGPLALGLAGFADAGRPFRTAAPPAEPWQLDVGLGLRVGLGSQGGELRLDAAHGLRDGRGAVSVGLRAPWPGEEP